LAGAQPKTTIASIKLDSLKKEFILSFLEESKHIYKEMEKTNRNYAYFNGTSTFLYRKKDYLIAERDKISAALETLLFSKHSNHFLAKKIIESIEKFNKGISYVNQECFDLHGCKTEETSTKFSIVDLFYSHLQETPELISDITDILIIRLRELYYNPSRKEHTNANYHQYGRDMQVNAAIWLIHFYNKNNLFLSLQLKAAICEDHVNAPFMMERIKKNQKLNIMYDTTIVSFYYSNTSNFEDTTLPKQQDQNENHSRLFDDSYQLLAEAKIDTPKNRQIIKNANSENIYKAMKRLLDETILYQDNFLLICHHPEYSLALAQGLIILYNNAIDTSYHKFSLTMAPQFAMEVATSYAALANAGTCLDKDTRIALSKNAKKLDNLHLGLEVLEQDSTNPNKHYIPRILMLNNPDYAHKIAQASIILESAKRIRNPWLILDEWNYYIPHLDPQQRNRYASYEYRKYEDDEQVPAGYRSLPSISCLAYADEAAYTLKELHDDDDGCKRELNEKVECQVYYTIAILNYVKQQNSNLDTRETANKIRRIIYHQYSNSY
jgi:hypothetical protein